MAAKTLLAIDDYDWHAGIVLFAQLGIGIHVDFQRRKPVANEKLFGLFAKMTAGAGEEEDLMRHGKRLLPAGDTDYCESPKSGQRIGDFPSQSLCFAERVDKINE
jgi:hypothetical protein